MLSRLPTTLERRRGANSTASSGERGLGASFAGLKALIVEDNAHMRGLLRGVLAELGITEAFEAPDGQRALEMLGRVQPDLVLTDLAMVPMDGIQFTRAVRNSPKSANPYVPIVMVTGHTTREVVLAARDAGVTEFLAKPVTTRNLLLRLAEIAERPRPFVRSDVYFGPDRRRHNDAFYNGPWRRADDKSGVALI